MARWSGNPDFDLFRLPDEHNELRAVLRDLCEKEIAPYAADVDEHSRFPEEALKALNAAGFSAVHVPEEYGGQGADAVATCIVIEEVARVDASASLIPGVNKLGTMGLILCRLRRTQEAGAAVASRPVRRWRPMRCRSGRQVATPRDAHPCPPGRRFDWILNGTKCWITNGGKSTWYTVMAVDRPGQGRQRHLGVHGAQGRRGLHRRTQGAQARHQGLADHRAVFRELPHSRATGSSASRAPASRPR